MVAPAIQSGLLDLRADGEIPNRFGMEGTRFRRLCCRLAGRFCW
jgi:hypothetical protein